MMFNIMLDKLPTEYEGFPIDSDFQTGIQIMQALEDEELTEQEQIWIALSLLFLQEDKDGNPLPFPDEQTAVEGLMWFLTNWNHDHNTKTDKTRVTDYDIDQWRIYSAFRKHYGINLNTDKLHFWEFMGLLSTLPECAYTQVIDIRTKKLSKLSKGEKEIYKKLKEVYALEQPAKDYTDAQKQSIDEYDRMMEEQKKNKEAKKLAAEAFKSMVENNKKVNYGRI